MTDSLSAAVPADPAGSGRHGTVTAAQVAQYRALGAWRDTTVADDLRRLAAEAPERLALISHFWETSQEADVLLSYAELSQRVDQVAAGLLDLGVGRGDRVAMQLVNQWQATVLALACARAGAVIVPMFIATGPADAEYILRESGAKVAVTLDQVRGLEVAATLAQIRERLPELRHHVVVGAAGPAGALSYDRDLLGSGSPDRCRELDARAPGADDTWQIMYTSGTTGRPKGVMHSFNTLHAMARAYTGSLQLGPDDVLTTPAVVGGQGGFLLGLVCPLTIGGTALWSDAFRPDDLLDLAQRYGLTCAYVTPLFLEPLTAEQRDRPRELRLRRLVAGSTPIPPAMPVDVQRAFGLPLNALWGMTENGCVTITRPGDPWDWAVSSDGRPVDWMALRLVGEDGAQVPPDAAGRLEVRGANQCLGYYQGDDLYAEVLHDGWFQTGDIAAPDGRGGIKILGRVKDMINKGGIHVPSVQVEGLLLQHPAVADVALVGERVLPLGERIVAFVVPAGEPPSLESLQAHVRAAGMTMGYEPDRLEIVTELPRTSTGKVLKRELEQRVNRS